MTQYATMSALAASLLAGSFATTTKAEPVVAVTQNEPSPEACTRTIQAMGASMGFKPIPGEKPQFLFTLRVNGVDYTALCDAQTGNVKDVVLKASH